MGSMRDFMDQRKARAPEPRAVDPKPGKPPRKVEKAPGEVVTFLCGCKVGVAHLRGSKCHACQVAHAVQRAERRAQQGRLPDGSTYETTYSAAEQLWRGILEVPANGRMQAFRGTASGVRKLIDKLGDQYRSWVRQQEESCGEKEEGYQKQRHPLEQPDPLHPEG